MTTNSNNLRSFQTPQSTKKPSQWLQKQNENVNFNLSPTRKPRKQTFEFIISELKETQGQVLASRRISQALAKLNDEVKNAKVVSNFKKSGSKSESCILSRSALGKPEQV